MGLIDSIDFSQFKSGVWNGLGTEFEYIGGWLLKRGKFMNDELTDGSITILPSQMRPDFVERVFAPLRVWNSKKSTQEK
jgi:hypothetical protein